MNKATIERLKTKHYETSVYRSETEAKKESYGFKWGQEIKASTKRIKALERAIKDNDEKLKLCDPRIIDTEINTPISSF